MQLGNRWLRGRGQSWRSLRWAALDIPMELSQWVGDYRVDEAKFIFHVAPWRASTGNRYANLMHGLLNWLMDVPGWDSAASVVSGHPLETLRMVEYVETIVQKGAGRYTPSSFPWASDLDPDLEINYWKNQSRNQLKFIDFGACQKTKKQYGNQEKYQYFSTKKNQYTNQ